MKTTTLTVTLPILLGVLHAQSPLSGLAQGFIIHDTISDNRAVLTKPAGDRNLQPFSAVHSSAPTYTTTALLHHLPNAASAAVMFRMNSISTGNDNIPASASADGAYWEVQPAGGGGWAAIALSVAQQEYTDVIPSSVFDRRLQSHGLGRGNDLFSYWFHGNVTVPPALVDQSFFELGPEHMALSSTAQVTGLDTYMPAVVEARNNPTPLVPVTNKWIFTLTPSTVSAVNPHWQVWEDAFDPALSQIGCNRVYTSTWDPVTGWSRITELFAAWELDLEEGDEIDAIAYFQQPNYDERIVFSLSKATSGSRQQLLIGGTNIDPLGANKPLRIQGNQSITERIGIGNDTDVDSICTYDPDAAQGLDFCRWMAMPEDTQAATSIGSSAARFRNYDGGNELDHGLLLQATNLPNEVGDVIWFLTIGTAPAVRFTKARTGDRTHLFVRLPLSVTESIVINTYFVSTTVRTSWSLKLREQ